MNTMDMASNALTAEEDKDSLDEGLYYSFYMCRDVYIHITPSAHPKSVLLNAPCPLAIPPTTPPVALMLLSIFKSLL